MGRAGLFVALASAGGLISLAGCAAILGDFTTEKSGVDASTDTGNDVVITNDAAPDVVNESGPPDTGPPCGKLTQSCCATGPACSGSAVCCSNTCIDLNTDPKNCGTCAHDCRGGSLCQGGQCQPFLLGSSPDKDPTSLAISQTGAYYGVFNAPNAGKFLECDLVNGCGNQPKILVQGTGFAGDVVQDATTVWMTDFNSSVLYIYSKSTQTYTTSQYQSIGAIDLEGVNLFFVSVAVPYQMKVDLTNQIALNNGSSEGAYDMAADGNGRVYWSRPGFNDIRTAAAGSPNSASFFAAVQGAAGTVAASKLYVAWSGTDTNTGKSTIFTCPTGSCSSPTPIVQNVFLGARQGNILVVGPDVYYTIRDGFSKQVEVYRCAATGCQNSPRLLGVVPTQPGTAQPGALARDQLFVYFLVGDSVGTRLFRVQDP